MTTHAIQVKTDPDPFENFLISQAFRVGDWVITSGQAAIAPTGELVGVGDFDLQVKQTMTNLSAVLEAAGSSLGQVFKVTIYLRDMANFDKIMALRAAYFSPPYPADTIVEVSSLALPELEIEIEAMALVNDGVLCSASNAT
jgi:reactive intermediate/imine deaminase